MLEDLKPQLGELREKLAQMETSLEVPAKEEKIAELEYKMGEPTFWDDAEQAQKINQELNDVKISVDKYKALLNKFEDAETLFEMGMEEDDASMEEDVKAELDAVAEGLEALQLEVLLSGPYDANNAILTLHAGAGGTEAQDWTQMLLRMYCDIMPEIDDAVEVDINMSDVRVDTYRASGAGGQHINKTSSAVRMTHEPTGIVVQCQNERSQLQNREQCLKMLRAKLFELEMEKKEAELAKLEGDQQNIEWGSQIRSYVFQPYTMVKDHRTNHETGNVQAVMDGEIDPFIRAFLNAKANHEF